MASFPLLNPSIYLLISVVFTSILLDMPQQQGVGDLGYFHSTIFLPLILGIFLMSKYRTSLGKDATADLIKLVKSISHKKSAS
jgi:hypothetical protein